MSMTRQTKLLITIIIFLTAMLAAGLSKRGLPGLGDAAFPEAQTEQTHVRDAG